ncbi:MAG: hypothetical protein GF364_16530 [Candidatus Lokiarchaeota archaeon]|nr:hypothetical protein [Candidatus Lokiarchaeota archaeon]
MDPNLAEDYEIAREISADMKKQVDALFRGEVDGVPLCRYDIKNIQANEPAFEEIDVLFEDEMSKKRLRKRVSVSELIS